MRKITQDENLNENLTQFPECEDLIEKVRSGKVNRTDDIINDYGVSFYFLGPCDQCGKYKETYITVNAVDDYGRDTEGLMCSDCVKDAMQLINEE